MIREIGILLLCAQLNYAMEITTANLESFYRHEIIPQLSQYSPIKEETGVQLCTYLAHAMVLLPHFGFNADWRYHQLIQWISQNKDNINVQIDTAIAKRLIAHTLMRGAKEGIAQRPEGANKSLALAMLAKEIADGCESLRIVVTGDQDSCVSDQAINARWRKFVNTAYNQSRLIKSLGIDE